MTITGDKARPVRLDAQGTREDRPNPSSAGVTPAKLRRRPMLGVLSAALICGGALVGVWVYASGSDAEQVLALRTTVQRGQVISADDLVGVRVSLDPALSPVPVGERDAIVGKRAASDLRAGSLLTPGAVATTMVPAQGEAVVGIALTPGMVPGIDLVAGDEVRLVLTPGTSGEPEAGEPSSKPATVLSVHDAVDGNGLLVDVIVPEADAPQVTSWAATGRVGLVLESRER